MSNFYRDNKDIENVIDALDLTEVATLLEEDFRFAKEYDFAPKDAADAIDNYKRALDGCGDVMANRIAPLAEETDAVGSVLNPDGSVTYAPGSKPARTERTSASARSMDNTALIMSGLFSKAVLMS